MPKCIADGEANIPHVQDFYRVLPNSESFITHYSGKFGDPVWNSRAVLPNGYELFMKFPIELNRDRTSVVSFSSPEVTVLQTIKTETHPDGTTIDHHGDSRIISPDTWKEFIQSNGDLSILELDIGDSADPE